MFKKQLDDLKTSAPLRNSDRRKLKQRVLQEFCQSDQQQDLGDLLVPEGLQSVKFTTHSGEPGLAYLSADGEPLWFTLGKGSNDLIPTVYTLWKKPSILPYLSTPSVVIPVLQNGADLMSAGVVEMLGNPPEGSLVAITVYKPGFVGPALAVGYMAVPGARVREDDARGKAVRVLHVFKDKLWEMGGRAEPPEPRPKEAAGEKDGEAEAEATPPPASPSPPEAGEEEAGESVHAPPLDPQEVSSLLRTALLQSIRTTLSSPQPSTFPLPSTLLYTLHILPARPAPHPSAPPSPTPLDIKHSAHKNLSAFLRSAEREGLLRLKGSGGGGGGDVQVLGVNASHPDVLAHRVYHTLGEVEARREKREEREAMEAKRPREIGIVELWKPHQQSIRLFEESEKDSTALYTQQEIKETLNGYINAKSLVNPHQQQFINIDDLLNGVLATKGSDVPEFMRRDELTRRLIEKMQPWHRIEADGKDAILKKGKLLPILITLKNRQGRQGKACTFITRFEAYQLSAEALAEELRRACAGSTAVAPLPGNGKGMEVMVQGRQVKAVRELLAARGVPGTWIEESDLTGKKK